MENEEVKNELEQDNLKSPTYKNSGGMDLTFRDDQHDYDWFLDALRKGKPRGLRFRLVDSGIFEGHQLEKIVRMGADLYTTDRVRKDILELEFILKAATSGGTIVASFLQNEIVSEEEHGFIPLASLAHLGKQGLFVHVSNRERERDLADLSQIAVECRKGSSRLIYYHHGRMTPEFVGLAKEGVWIHVSNKSIQSEDDLFLFLDMTAAARMSGANCVLYVEKEMSFSSLHQAVESPAIVLFKTTPADFKSPLRPLMDEAKRKNLDYRAFYLYSTFLP
ncbi:MAG: hypothetical protein MUP98_03885 [Candidatus Aminicenantes bacterium]|nr:hypothetical protein [Candidatus Aminicenantes bacterium]